MRTTMRTFFKILSALSLAAFVSCAADTERAPFLIEIRSTDVAATAFTDVEIVIEPRMPSESFTTMGEQVFFNGNVRTSVAGRSLVVKVKGPYFRGGNMPAAGETIRVKFPVYAETDLDAPSGSDPTIAVFFLNGNVRIAQGTSVLSWPLVDGRTSAPIEVACDAASTAACSGE